MTQVFESAETMQRQFFFLEERNFYNRAKTDRVVGAGIASRDGRGGFDFLALQLSNIGARVDELRARYAVAGAGECPALNLVAASTLSFDH